MISISNFFDELKLRTDSHVADFGCGHGQNVRLLSDLVPKGKVFAIDLTKSNIENLEDDIKKEAKKKEGEIMSLQNVVPVWADFENTDGSRLRDDSIDCLLISNTFYLLKHKKTAAVEMKRVLKKKGRILFVDWHKHLGNSSLHRELVLKEGEVEQLFVDLGMKVHPLVHKDDNHFVLVIEK